MQRIIELVGGTTLIFIGVLVAGSLFEWWTFWIFLKRMWPCLMIVPSFLMIKQRGRQLWSVQMLGHSTLLLLYTWSFLSVQSLIGWLLGYASVIFGLWFIQKSFEVNELEQ